MRYAIISDIHANLQAFNAVMADVRAMGCTEILCLGDVVGYGPHPAEVLQKAYSRVNYFVLGNHDAVICGDADAADFNDDARTIIEWTRQQLDDKACAFFKELPLLAKGPDFRCAHGEFVEPLRFRYIVEAGDAAAAWGSCPEPLLFVGHTHKPGLFVVGQSGTPHWLDPQNFSLEEGKRYIVNVGSVGQPRDGDMRGGYCIYEPDTRTVLFRRVAFDVDAYREDLRKAALPEKPQYFLFVAAQTETPPLRDMLDFRPPAKAARTEYKVADLETALRSARRWRLLTLACACLLLLAVALAAFVYWRMPRTVSYPAREAAAPAETATDDAAELLPAPDRLGVVDDDQRLQAWSVQLQAGRGQSVCVEAAGDTRLFRLTSGQLQPLRLVSWALPARQGDRFQVKAQFYAGGLKTGHVALQLVLDNPDGTQTVVEQKEAKDLAASKDDWGRPVQFTLAKDRGGVPRDGTVHVVVLAEFTGDLCVRGLSLQRRP